MCILASLTLFLQKISRFLTGTKNVILNSYVRGGFQDTGEKEQFLTKKMMFFSPKLIFFLCLKLSLPECAYNIELADPSTLPFKQKCGKNCILKHKKTSKNINFGSEMALKMPILFSQNIDT